LGHEKGSALEAKGGRGENCGRSLQGDSGSIWILNSNGILQNYEYLHKSVNHCWSSPPQQRGCSPLERHQLDLKYDDLQLFYFLFDLTSSYRKLLVFVKTESDG